MEESKQEIKSVKKQLESVEYRMDKLVDALVDRLLPTERIQRKYGEEEIKKRPRNS